MKKKLKIPKFQNEDQERNFWGKLDLSNYFEKSDFTSIHNMSLYIDSLWARLGKKIKLRKFNPQKIKQMIQETKNKS